MKKFNNINKKGFTLLEMVVTIGIIVILTSAASVGIALDMNKYQKYLEEEKNIEKNGGWEYEARMAVDAMTLKESDDFSGGDDKVPAPEVSGGGANSGGATDGNSDSTPEPTKAPDPTKAPEPTKAPDPTTAPEPTKAPEPTTAPAGGADITSQTNAGSPNTWGSGGQIGLKLPGEARGKKVVITVEFPGANINSVGGWNWQGNGSSKVNGTSVEITINKIGDNFDFGIQVGGSNVNSAKLVSVKVM